MCASSSLFTFISKLGMTPVLDHGSEALKQKYVHRVASGECQASYCLSEADAGSDVSGMRTRAVRDGDHYVLTGQKLWITNAGVSDFYTVFAKTDPTPATAASAASSSRRRSRASASRSSSASSACAGHPTGEITLDECRGAGREPRSATRVAASTTRWAPSTAPARSSARRRSVSHAARSICATGYVKERKQFGSRLADFQGLQFMLADMATQVDAAELLVYRACSLLDAGLPGTG